MNYIPEQNGTYNYNNNIILHISKVTIITNVINKNEYNNDNTGIFMLNTNT